jgi:hypothetical protein
VLTFVGAVRREPLELVVQGLTSAAIAGGYMGYDRASEQVVLAAQPAGTPHPPALLCGAMSQVGPVDWEEKMVLGDGSPSHAREGGNADRPLDVEPTP